MRKPKSIVQRKEGESSRRMQSTLELLHAPNLDFDKGIENQIVSTSLKKGKKNNTPNIL